LCFSEYENQGKAQGFVVNENENIANKRPRRKLSEETKAKIAASNTGKIFSAERRANIGKARLFIPSNELVAELQEQWAKRYVPAKWIMEKFGLASRVYLRLQKEHCQVEQIKFLPQELHPTVFESIIEMCLDRTPCSVIADFLKLEYRQVHKIILKLAPFYGLELHSKPPPAKTEEHKEKLREHLRTYNKEHPLKKEENPNWKGGIAEFASLVRVMPQYREWRRFVMERDMFRCVFCKAKGYLHVDHIYPFCLLLRDGEVRTIEAAANYSPLWNTNNGRTLCVKCHKETETYGKQTSQYNEQF
jgi:5-methylcytosine-specific restriction endonuclease McrA